MKITTKQVVIVASVGFLVLLAVYINSIIPFSRTAKVEGQKVVLSEKYPNAMYEYRLTGNENADLPVEDDQLSRYTTVWKDNTGFQNTSPLEQTEYKATNGDTYNIEGDLGYWNLAILKKNGKKVWQDSLIFTTYDPMRVRFITGNTFVLAYNKYEMDGVNGYKPPLHNVIYNDGIDVNKSYGFTSSFAPASVSGKPGIFYFFGVDAADKSYLVVGDKKYELPYTGIIDPPCCSPAVFAVRHNGEQTAFFGKKNGSWYFVVINVKDLVDNG